MESSNFSRHGNLPPAQQAIRAKCFHPTGMFVEFPREEVEQSIPQRFEQMVSRYPDRIAVQTKRHVLTYAELNAKANKAGRAILAKYGEGKEPVALLLEHEAPMIVAILGVLKAGKVCVVLDASLPGARLAYMLEQSQSGFLITDRKHLSLATELTHDVSRLTTIDQLEAGNSIENLGLSISPDDLTYIVYTSGSTGEPKGVIQNHRNGLHEAMLYANGLHISAYDRLALLYSCSASQGMKITFGALLNGAALCLFNLEQEGIRHLADWLIRDEITIYFSIPIVFRQLTSTFTGHETFPKLRLIQLGSDSVTAKEVEGYKKHFSSDTTLVIRLGSTETGTLRTYFFERHSQLAERIVPVGYGVEDMQVYLLDEESNEVDFNCVGEIVVKSRYLSPGYWQRPDLTNSVFLPDPAGGPERIYRTGDLGRMRPDGCLEHLGRKDFQTKIRGYRVEVAEIETALLEVPEINEAVVLARSNERQETELVAYVVAESAQAPTIGKLRASLKEKLPEYMVPTRYVLLEAMPLTANGKIDRRALSTLNQSTRELDVNFVAPRTITEKEIARIWTDLLHVKQLGIHDNFFELGGHSLLATQIISKVLETLEVELPVASLFENPTVAGLATQIELIRGKSAASIEIADVLADLESLSDREAEHLLARETRKRS
jgi:amino acid adenylation domain-containing protein